MIDIFCKELSAIFIAVTHGLSESLYVLANEPSLGLFRLQEHVHRSVPELVERKVCLYSKYARTITHTQKAPTFKHHASSVQKSNPAQSCRNTIHTMHSISFKKRHCLEWIQPPEADTPASPHRVTCAERAAGRLAKDRGRGARCRVCQRCRAENARHPAY